VNRRAFVTGLGATLAMPLVAKSQLVAAASARIGFLGNSDFKTEGALLNGFRQGLQDFGLIEGQTIAIEYRWAEGKPERLPSLAADLVRLKPEVIVVSGSPAVRAAQQATRTIPSVIAALLVDPVRAGFVASFARPGGNITGLASQYEEIGAKQMQLLTEAIPGIARMVLLRDGGNPGAGLTATAAAAAATKLGVHARLIEVRQPNEFEGAFQTAREGRAQAIHVLPSPFFSAHRRALIKLAEINRLPALYEFRQYVEDGGFMSYGVDIRDMYRRSASFVDRILKGATPADLPIERPTKFELVMNVKTAKALGLTIPPSLLLRADQVIE
jgi:putative tryptophan/tyrosine transport system substrate-binding protein